MLRELGKVCLSVVVVAALAAPALADDVEGAKAAFMEGKKAYNVGEYDRAIEHYKAGYSLSPRADFLYNIGQCYYQIKNWERAKFFYERYLSEAPDAGDAEEVRGILRELDDRLASGDAGSGDPGRPSDPGYDTGRDDGYDSRRDPGPAPEPVAVTGRASKRFLIALSAGFFPTNFCGRSAQFYDCFLAVVADFNIRLWDPRFLTLYLDLQAMPFTDGAESGLAVGGGVRLRLDKWWRFVPYVLGTFNIGIGSFMASTTFRPNVRFAAGAEISLRSPEGRGVGFFGEVGGGSGACSFLGSGPCYSDFFGAAQAGYAQWSISAGVSF